MENLELKTQQAKNLKTQWMGSTATQKEQAKSENRKIEQQKLPNMNNREKKHRKK